jgi:hypothetical protein
MVVVGGYNVDISGIGSTNPAGIGSTEPFQFYEFEQPEQEEYYDPFVQNEDGTLDLFLTGKIVVDGNGRFKSDVNIPNGRLYVQEVDILQELQDLKASIGPIQSDIATLFLSLQS